jgi:hypothetical protein
MEAVISSETSVNVYQNAECQIPALHTHIRENFKFHNLGLEALYRFNNLGVFFELRMTSAQSRLVSVYFAEQFWCFTIVEDKKEKCVLRSFVIPALHTILLGWL